MSSLSPGKIGEGSQPLNLVWKASHCVKMWYYSAYHDFPSLYLGEAIALCHLQTPFLVGSSIMPGAGLSIYNCCTDI